MASSSSSFFSERVELPTSYDINKLESLARLARGDSSVLTAEIQRQSQQELEKMRMIRVCLRCQERYTKEDNIQRLGCFFHDLKFEGSPSGWACCYQRKSWNTGCLEVIHVDDKKTEDQLLLEPRTTYTCIPKYLIDNNLIKYNPELLTNLEHPTGKYYLFRTAGLSRIK